MQFNETGLPLDATVFKAFTMYAKNVATTPAAKPRQIEPGVTAETPEAHDNYAVRVAQLLNETGNTDPQLLSLALLNVMPPQTYGIVEKSFGKPMIELLNEAIKHNKTAFAYVAEASENVKLLTLAAAVATFEEFRGEAQKAEEMLLKMADGQQPANGRLMIPMIPDMRIYERLSEVLFDKTTSRTLEETFREKLSDFKNDNDRLKNRIIEMGLAEQLPPQIAYTLNRPDTASFRYPTFEETGLLDTPKVRAAYDVIISHPFVPPEGFEAALEVGKMLTDKLEAPNPTAVATGLLMTGMQHISPEDFEFLDKKLDWDVTDLMKRYGGETGVHPRELAAAPIELKQVLLANSIASLGSMPEGIKSMKEMIEQQEDIPEKVRPMILAENLNHMLMMTDMMDQSRRVIGNSEAPQLDAMFKDLMKQVRAEINANMPQLPKGPFGGMGGPGGRGPRPTSPGGQSFDLD
ncbi:MAG: hypothetical protein PSY14_13470 [bacterium]|nr:hypothetical protein [bacterium]